MKGMPGNGANMAIRQSVRGSGTKPDSREPLAELNDRYGKEWKVWRPGRYVADHRWLDVTLISDSVPGLAEKLRGFTDLIRDLP